MKHASIEALEARIAPASIVTVIVSNGNLTVSVPTDDTEAQGLGFSEVMGSIRIAPAADVQLQLGKNATPLAAGASADISGVTGNIKIVTGGGNDSVALGSMTAPRSVTVDVGAGNDSVFFTSFTANGSVNVLGGDGDDGIGFFGTHFQASGPVSILTGEGKGTTFLASDTITVPKSLTIKGGSGEDTVSTTFLALSAAKNVTIGSLQCDLGAGVSKLTITPATKLDVAKDISLTAKNADAVAASFRVGSLGDIEVGGKVSAKFGSGTNSFIFGADRDVSALGQSISVIGKITCLGGSGDDKFLIGAKTISAGSISAKLGDGNNEFTLGVNSTSGLDQVATITGKIAYQGGSGNDEFKLGIQSLTASAISVKAGDGFNGFNIENSKSLSVSGALSFSGDGGFTGGNSFKLAVSNTELGSLRLSSKGVSLAIILGTVDVARDVSISSSIGGGGVSWFADGSIGGKFSMAFGAGAATTASVSGLSSGTSTGAFALSSVGPMTALLGSLVVRGATNLKFGNAVDTLSIAGATFTKSFSASFGDGNDLLGIEGTGNTATTTFAAATKFDLGKGNDSAQFGTGGGTAMVNFNALWKLVGGPGTNTATLQAGKVNEPAGHIFTNII